MEGKKFVIALTITATVFSVASRGVDNSAVSRGTVPLSSTRSGLIRSRDPIDRSGDLLITGNVSGGRQFRGLIPYQSPTSFQRMSGILPSDVGTLDPYTTLDPFRRQASGSGGVGTYVGRTTPFYPISSTVTRMPPGQRDVLTTPMPRIDYRAKAKPLLPVFGRPKISAEEQEVPKLELPVKPVVPPAEQPDKVTFSDVDKYMINKRLIMGLKERQLERLQEELKETEPKKAESQGELTGVERSMKLRSEGIETATEKVLKPFELPVRQEPTKKAAEPDVYEQMKQQAEEFEKTFEKLPAEKKAEKGEKDQAEEDSQGGGPLSGDFPSKFKSRLDGRFGKEMVSKTDQPRKVEDVFSKIAREDYLAWMDVSARARGILGEHKTFASYSQDKFNQYLREAEGYLKDGKYYLAARTYDLALIYKPKDPLVYAGKGHALFGAGEYMSSALYIARALEIFPEYARFKIYLEEMTGDRDHLESRIKDVGAWLEHSDAGELHFLLGYVYFQMGRYESAAESIGKAYEKLPDAPAVITLKKAIEDITKS